MERSMKPRCLHQFDVTKTVTEGQRRSYYLKCSLCPCKRTRNRTLKRFQPPSSTRQQKQGKASQNGLKCKRKAIKPVSDKRAVQNRRYLVLRKEFLEENPMCAVTGRPATEVHHRAGREGEWLLNTDYWLPVSREGHDFIENNRAEAKKRGWLITRKSSK